MCCISRKTLVSTLNLNQHIYQINSAEYFIIVELPPFFFCLYPNQETFCLNICVCMYIVQWAFEQRVYQSPNKNDETGLSTHRPILFSMATCLYCLFGYSLPHTHNYSIWFRGKKKKRIFQFIPYIRDVKRAGLDRNWTVQAWNRPELLLTRSVTVLIGWGQLRACS